MIERMFGTGDKVKVYLAAADAQTVVLAYISTKSLKRALSAAKTPKKGLASDTDVGETMALLPADAQWVGMISPSGFMSLIRGMVGGGVGPGGAPILPGEFPETAPVGFAARLGSSSLDTDFVVPAGLLKATGEFVQKVRGGQ
jgi:hypothetical protein